MTSDLRPSRSAISIIAGFAAFSLCQTLALLVPGMKMLLFCEPAGWIASLFLGVSSGRGESGFLLAHPGIEIHVVEACSGFDFFSMVFAVLAGMAFARARRPLLSTILFLPLSFGIALAANSARIVCAVQARLHADLLPTGISFEAVHLAVGVCVFVTALAATAHLTHLHYENS